MSGKKFKNWLKSYKHQILGGTLVTIKWIDLKAASDAQAVTRFAP
jgi:hypothetical protein